MPMSLSLMVKKVHIIPEIKAGFRCCYLRAVCWRQRTDFVVGGLQLQLLAASGAILLIYLPAASTSLAYISLTARLTESIEAQRYA